MSLHSLPPPDFANEMPLVTTKPRSHRTSAGQQAEATEAYATAVLRVLRQARPKHSPSQLSADDD